MWEDPIVSEVRRTARLSERFDFDVEAIFADICNRQVALARGWYDHRRNVHRNAPKSTRASGPFPFHRFFLAFARWWARYTLLRVAPGRRPVRCEKSSARRSSPKPRSLPRPAHHLGKRKAESL